MKRVLLVAFGAGIVGSMAGFLIPSVFARDQGLVLLSILTGPFGFILGFAVGFVYEAGRQDILSARRIVSLLYIAWFLMSLYYLYFVDRVNEEILFGTTILQTIVVIAICGILMLERSSRELPPAVRSRQKICAIAALVMTAMLFFPPVKRNPLAGSGQDFETGYLYSFGRESGREQALCELRRRYRADHPAMALGLRRFIRVLFFRCRPQPDLNQVPSDPRLRLGPGDAAGDLDHGVGDHQGVRFGQVPPELLEHLVHLGGAHQPHGQDRLAHGLQGIGDVLHHRLIGAQRVQARTDLEVLEAGPAEQTEQLAADLKVGAELAEDAGDGF